MRLFLGLLILIFVGCAKSPNGGINGNSIFYSTTYSYTAYPNGSNEAPCHACFTMEINQSQDLRLTFSDVHAELGSCMGRGSGFYIPENPLYYPESVGNKVNWFLRYQGSDFDVDCFPEQLFITIEHVSSGEFLMEYNNGAHNFRIKKN